MSEPRLTNDKNALCKFIVEAKHGITCETLQILTTESSKHCTFREILSLMKMTNGSYTFTVEDEEYLSYISCDNKMYIFKLGECIPEDGYQFIRRYSDFDNCVYMVDKQTRVVLCCYDADFKETTVFKSIIDFFPETTEAIDISVFKTNIILRLSEYESKVIGLEKILLPYKLLCEMDS